MTKMSKDKRDKLLLTIIAGVGSVCVLYFVVIAGQKDTLVDLGLRIDALRGKRENSDRTVKRQAQFQENLELQRKTLDKKQEQMPRPGEDQRWFNRIIESRQEKYGIELWEIKTAQAVDPGVLPKFPFKGVAFTVTVDGAYSDFGEFLRDFENEFPYMRVQLESISPLSRAPIGSGPLGAPAAPSSSREPSKLRFVFRVISLIKTPTS